MKLFFYQLVKILSEIRYWRFCFNPKSPITNHQSFYRRLAQMESELLSSKKNLGLILVSTIVTVKEIKVWLTDYG